MLRLFRGGGVSQVLVGGVAFAIIVVFALEFRAGRGATGAKLSEECAVEYAGNCVDQKDYYAAYGLIVPRGVSAKDVKRLGLRKKVLDGLVERELLVEEADRLGVGASDDVIEQELLAGRAHVSLPAEGSRQLVTQLGLCPLDEYGWGCAPGAQTMVRQLRVRRTPEEPFDYKLYEREVRIVANRGPKEFREMQERELVAARMRELVESRVRVPDAEAFMLYERDRSKAIVRSVILERSWFAKYTVNLDDAAVTKWAADNKAAVDTAWQSQKANFVADCPLVSEIQLELAPGASDADKAAQREKLEAVRGRLKKGESFAGIARQISEAPSAVQGGAVGCLGPSYGFGSEELIKAANALKPGDVSEVIETPRGLYVLKLTGKLAAADVESVGRRHVAEAAYLRARADEKLKAFAEALISRVKDGLKLEEATRTLIDEYAPSDEKAAADKDAEPPALADADRPKFEVSAPFSISGNPLPDVNPREPLAAKAFELKNADDLYEQPIETSSGAVVIQLKEKTSAKREEFDKEKDKILSQLREVKQEDALVRYIADLKRKAGDKLKVDLRFAEDPKLSGSEE